MEHRTGTMENMVNEILVIIVAVFSFMTAACFNKREVFAERPYVFAITAAVDLILVGILSWKAVLGLEKGLESKKYAGRLIHKNRGIFLTVFYCFITRVIQMGDIPRWDGLTYYRVLMDACDAFDFTFGSFLKNFAMVNHPTLAYAGVSAIGEFIWPYQYIGVLVVWMLINLMAAFWLYRILEKVLPACSWVYHTLAACAVMSTPLVLGTFSYFQPDAGTVSFFVFIIYCYLYKKNILMFFSMLLLIQTKEIGIVILCSFYVGIFLGTLLFKKGRAGKSILQFIRQPLGISGIVAVCFLGLYFIIFLKNGGTIWKISNDNIAGFSTFSFQPDFITYKWKQFFVLNFNWLVWGGNFFMFSISCIRSLKDTTYRGTVKRKEVVLAIALAAVLQMIFYCGYVTYALPRYHVLIDFCGVWLFVILVGSVLPDLHFAVKNIQIPVKFPACVFTGMTGFLLLLEAYMTVDPISLKAFQTVDTGNSLIISESRDVGAIQRDFSVYNHQFNYLNRAYDHVLRSVQYQENMDIIIWGSVVNDEIWASGIWWDEEKQKRTFAQNENAIPVAGIEREEIDRGSVSLQKEAVFILTPQFYIAEDIAEEYLKQYYEIRYKGYVDVPMGGRVTYYVCDLIDRKVVQG